MPTKPHDFKEGDSVAGYLIELNDDKFILFYSKEADIEFTLPDKTDPNYNVLMTFLKVMLGRLIVIRCREGSIKISPGHIVSES